MSDPHGETPHGETPGPYGQNPYGQNPYGQSPYSQSPYGAPSPYGGTGGYGTPGGFPGAAGAPPPTTDGVSIAALITSLLCCLAPVGVVLGLVGLSRTRGGRRKGRGLAISAIVVGVLMSIVSAAVAAIVFFFVDSLVPLDDAEVGQCVDVDEDDDTVIMREKECSEEHDGEIVATADVTAENIDAITGDLAAFCTSLIDAEDLVRLDAVDGLQYKAVMEDPDDISLGDHLVCYVEGDDDLTEPIL